MTDNDAGRTIALAEEDLTIDKRRLETGRVRIRTISNEHVEFARADLDREAVNVERVQIGREVDVIPDVRQEGDTLIIPVVEEVLVVEKRLVLREELHVVMTRSTERVEVPVNLRSMQAVVERREEPPEESRS